MRTMSDVTEHHQLVAGLLAEGSVVPFLGAGVNQCGRPGDEAFAIGQALPTGSELATYLRDRFHCPPDIVDLARVSQYAAMMGGGIGRLYQALYDVFNVDCPPTELHRFLADLPGLVRRAGRTPRLLIITTNYDDALEQAFAAASEPFDLVTYIAAGDDRGRFLHVDPHGRAEVIARPNEYDRLSLDERSVIVKIHGAVDRLDYERGNYVITEDDYIGYPTPTEITQFIPVTLATVLRRSNFLFLGYGLRDWNLRVILHRIWRQQRLGYDSWAVQLDPDPIDKKGWERRNVELHAAELGAYIDALREALTRELAPGVDA
jgi:SIR2-like domain